mmetsp:Transcript_17340/g.48080  ORF Transcript_17340/g.48080 Transcript_17340/m.48080 type:complete len:462 (+) Transcript_17340:832-2217(+)
MAQLLFPHLQLALVRMPQGSKFLLPARIHLGLEDGLIFLCDLQLLLVRNFLLPLRPLLLFILMLGCHPCPLLFLNALVGSLVNQRCFLLAVCAFQVVHGLGQLHQLALQLLLLAHALREGLLHEGALVEPLWRSTCCPLGSCSSLCAFAGLIQRLGFLQLPLLQLPLDALLLTPQRLLTPALLLRHFCLTGSNGTPPLLLLLSLHQGQLLLLLALLDDELARQVDTMVFLQCVHGVSDDGIAALLVARAACRLDYVQHLAQALTQQRDVAAHTLVLQLLAAEVEGAIAVVNAHLEVVRLDSIHHHALHLAERHEGHQLCERADAHSAVDLAQLLQQAQNSDLLERIDVLPERYVLDRGSRAHGLCDLLQACQEGRQTAAKLQGAELRSEQVKDLAHFGHHEVQDVEGLDGAQQRGARQHSAVVLLGVHCEAQDVGHAQDALLLLLHSILIMLWGLCIVRQD